MPLGKSKILITGGTGFLGYEITNHLSKKYDIAATARTIGFEKSNIKWS